MEKIGSRKKNIFSYPEPDRFLAVIVGFQSTFPRAHTHSLISHRPFDRTHIAIATHATVDVSGPRQWITCIIIFAGSDIKTYKRMSLRLDNNVCCHLIESQAAHTHKHIIHKHIPRAHSLTRLFVRSIQAPKNP